MSVTGTIVNIPPELDNATISHGGLGGDTYVPIGLTIPIFSNSPIGWKDRTQVPPSIRDLTLGQLLSNPLTRTSQYYTTLSLTGEQEGINGVEPMTVITAIDAGNGARVVATFYTDPRVSGIGERGVYNSTINLNELNQNFGVIQAISGVNVQANDEHYAAHNMTLTIVIHITLHINCTGQQLETSVCQNICQNGSPACLDNYVTYCLPPTGTAPVGTSQACQSYFADYIEQNGPNSKIDRGLASYCSSKYKGFGDLFDDTNTNTVDKELCACHMPQAQYDAYANQLFGRFPQLGAFAGNKLCLVPRCQSSKYAAEPIPKGGCKTPRCLVITNFNNDGTFNNDDININVDVPGCGPNDNNPGALSWEWIVAIAVVIVLFLVFIYLMTE